MSKYILNHTSMIPIYEQLMNQIRNAVLNGDLKPNDPLPSVRALSSELKISALTVKKTYDRLEEEGYTVTIHGKGTYIAEPDPVRSLEQRRMETEKVLRDALQRVHSFGLHREEIAEIFDLLLEENYD